MRFSVDVYGQINGRRSYRYGFGGQQHLPEFIALHTFVLREEVSQIIKNGSPLREDFSHALMGFIDKPGDLVIDLGSFGLTVLFSGRETFREKHRLARAFVAYQSQVVAHAIFRDHGARDVRRPLQIVLGPS